MTAPLRRRPVKRLVAASVVLRLLVWVANGPRHGTPGDTMIGGGQVLVLGWPLLLALAVPLAVLIRWLRVEENRTGTSKEDP